MDIELRLPSITAPTPDAQLVQMRSYLYSLVQELNWALKNVSAGAYTIQAEQTPSVGGSPQAVFNTLKPLIMASTEISNAFYDRISPRIANNYAGKEAFDEFSESASEAIQTNAENIAQIAEGIQPVEGLTGFVKFGEIAEDELGVILGKTESGSFTPIAKFTGESIEFYMGGDAIVRITGRVLYAESVQIGHYVMDSSDGLAWRWVE